MSILVKWGRERLHFALPPPDAKLAVLRKQIADYTQLPPDAFKLVHAGAVMKDDNAPISAYNITPSSTIQLIGGDTSAPTPSSSAAARGKAEPRTEEGALAQIRGELDAVRRTLVPDVDGFIAALSASSTSSATPSSSSASSAPASTPSRGKPKAKSGSKAQQQPAPSTPNEALVREHARLSELLLQALLRLDAVGLAGTGGDGWGEARAERKGAVREVQSVLDKLDGAWRARS
ncbi:hypothetical protein CERSUDRAFT_83529 [Gelatoporia subvermispora B]|uniref:Uncharacterized protein n=1 Tax=Ceriporiopsis subvermispora (strain B) TaxID=914234 RepID=M2RGZ8_CERS8|nr:hypothetical protein CERSUDRAFT_83529 [Gelatoporia subvermispora B]